jgi:RNA polymerase sigma-70 factor (ECF subfamily)
VAPPGNVELDSLLALMLLQHSRRDARVDAAGDLVLLPDQDRGRWHHEDIDEAVALLTPWTNAPGSPYLLQALIAAEHAIARRADDTDWPRVAARYLELEQLTGSPVVRLNRAVAVAEADGPLAGLALLDGLTLAGHRLPAVRGQLLLRLGRTDEARTELERAIELCGNDAERATLRRLLPD